VDIMKQLRTFFDRDPDSSKHGRPDVSRRAPPERLALAARAVAPRASPRSHGHRRPSEECLVSQEELEVPYTIKQHTRNADHSAPKELLEIHPLGKAPVITDGDITVAESGAIVGALIHLLPALYAVIDLWTLLQTTLFISMAVTRYRSQLKTGWTTYTVSDLIILLRDTVYSIYTQGPTMPRGRSCRTW
jgi:hypothetical protein